MEGLKEFIKKQEKKYIIYNKNFPKRKKHLQQQRKRELNDFIRENQKEEIEEIKKRNKKIKKN